MFPSLLNPILSDISPSIYNAPPPAPPGDEFVDSYVAVAMKSWNAYVGHFSAWETQNTLDC